MTLPTLSGMNDLLLKLPACIRKQPMYVPVRWHFVECFCRPSPCWTELSLLAVGLTVCSNPSLPTLSRNP